MRLIRVTHPDPCQPITFHDRVAVNRCRLGHRTMIIVNTLAIRPEPQPMIRAFNGISDKLSLREGSKSVGATVGKYDGCPICLTKVHDRMFEESPHDRSPADPFGAYDSVQCVSQLVCPRLIANRNAYLPI